MPDAVWIKRECSAATIGMCRARLCAKGAGLAVLPRPLGDETPGILRLDVGENPPGRDTYVGYHRDPRRGSVGMAGLALGGGYGPLIGRYGLALDNLLAVEIV